jgi:hypothetical protein
MLRHGRPDFPLPGNDYRITPTLIRVGQQQHSHHTPIHQFRGEHVGRQAQPPPRQRRQAARPLGVSRDGHSPRPPHDRLLCVGAKHATSPLQPPISTCEKKQLVQPPIATTTRPRPKAIATRSSHSGRPPLARKTWHHALTDLACHETVLPARTHLFHPGRRHGRGTIGKPHWPVIVFRIPFLPGCTSAGAQLVLPWPCSTYEKSD